MNFGEDMIIVVPAGNNRSYKVFGYNLVPTSVFVKIGYPYLLKDDSTVFVTDIFINAKQKRCVCNLCI